MSVQKPIIHRSKNLSLQKYFLPYIQRSTKPMRFKQETRRVLTLPKPNTAVIAGGGQHCARDVPADSPHLGIVIVKLSHDMNFKFC